MMAGINVYKDGYMPLGARNNTECLHALSRPYHGGPLSCGGGVTVVSAAGLLHMGVLPATRPRKEQYAPYRQGLERRTSYLQTAAGLARY